MLREFLMHLYEYDTFAIHIFRTRGLSQVVLWIRTVFMYDSAQLPPICVA